MGDIDNPVRKKGAEIKFFTERGIKVVAIAACGDHTSALSEDGKVYTWGSNDESALGRDGPENIPGEVVLPEKIDGICCGNSHSIAYSTETSHVYFWGMY